MATAFSSLELAPAVQLVVLGGALLVAVAVARRRPPKPPPNARKIHSLDTRIPIIGDLLEMTANAHRKHDWMLDQVLRFRGEPWLGHIVGMPEFVNFSDPRAIEEITTTHFDCFAKGPFQLGVIKDLLGRGIVASDGERWYHQRKAAAKFFTARSLRECVTHTMQRNIELVCRVLDASDAQSVNLTQLFHQFTLQTFGEAGLGVVIPIIGQKERNPFEAAIDAAFPIIARRGRLPPFVWKLERWFGVGEEKILADAMVVLKKWLRETIQQSLDSIQTRKTNAGKDTVPSAQSIVELYVDHITSAGMELHPDELVDFLLNFVIASRDTSALTTGWFFYALSQHPHVEQRIRLEMADKLDDKTRYLAADDIKSLTYLEATIKETLRLYPAGPNSVKQVMRDVVICGDIYLRKGQMVGISAWALGRNPYVWGPDAAEFKPERWIDRATGELVHVSPFKFFSFHAGPRSCVGMNLAMLNLRVVTANLLHRYQFDIDPANDGSYVNSPTLMMKHPLMATVALVEKAM